MTTSARPRRSKAAVVAVGAVAAVGLAALVTINKDQGGVSTPLAPVQQAPAAAAAPIPADWPQWRGRGMWVEKMRGESWTDPEDSSVMGVDLTSVAYSPGGSSVGWRLGLAGWPERATLAEGTVLSYGVVVDSSRDGIGDYMLGIDRRGPTAAEGTYRVWVTSRATGETEVQDGPPYGYPLEFAHSDGEPGSAGMSLWFLGSAPLEEPAHARWFAWSALRHDGELVARDTAPDTGWLQNR